MSQGNARYILSIVSAVILFSCIHKAPEIPDTVSVGIFSKYKVSSVRIHGDQLKTTGGTASSVFLTIRDRTGMMDTVIDGHRHSLKKIEISSPLMELTAATQTGEMNRSYSGVLTAEADKDRIKLINRIGLDFYAHNTALAELGGFISKNHAEAWEQELLKAQEVAVRSYAASQIPRHEDYDLCDLTHCAVYYGIIDNTGSLTSGEILFSDGKIVPGYFHSACGGNTRKPSSFWEGESDNGFRERTDAYEGESLCSGSPNYRWRSETSVASLCGIFGLSRIKSLYTSCSEGRPVTVNFDTGDDLISIPASSFISRTGKALGWNIVKSPAFTAEIRDSRIILRGSGLGHGIGLCQHGAMQLAGMGKKYREILSFYYAADIVKGVSIRRREK